MWATSWRVIQKGCCERTAYSYSGVVQGSSPLPGERPGYRLPGSNTEWSLNPFMSLELSVTLIAMIIAPFVGHSLSARLCEAHSTSLPIMEFNTQAQPLKQVPPLYGQNPQDLRECTFLSTYLNLQLCVYLPIRPFFLLPCRTGTQEEAVSPSTLHNAQSSIDRSYLLNEGMQPRSPAGYPSCQEAEQNEQNTRQALPEPCSCNPPPCRRPFSPVPKLQGRKEKMLRYNGRMHRGKDEQPAAWPSLSTYGPKPPEHSCL